jgi:hypothetical protein
MSRWNEDEHFNHPRMRDYLTAADLSTEGCLQLAEEVLQEASEEYVRARRAVVAHPNDRDAQEHFKTCQAFYRSDWFAALSGGVMDGETVMRRLNKEAVRGWRVRATAT